MADRLDGMWRCQAIGTTLVQLLAALPDTPAETAVEVLNALYDIYDDAAHDYDAAVFVAGGFLNVLCTSEPAVRRLVKVIDRRQYPSLRERAEEALINLRAFINYKRNESRS